MKQIIVFIVTIRHLPAHFYSHFDTQAFYSLLPDLASKCFLAVYPNGEREAKQTMTIPNIRTLECQSYRSRESEKIVLSLYMNRSSESVKSETVLGKWLFAPSLINSPGRSGRPNSHPAHRVKAALHRLHTDLTELSL